MICDDMWWYKLPTVEAWFCQAPNLITGGQKYEKKSWKNENNSKMRTHTRFQKNCLDKHNKPPTSGQAVYSRNLPGQIPPFFPENSAWTIFTSSLQSLKKGGSAQFL